MRGPSETQTARQAELHADNVRVNAVLRAARIAAGGHLACSTCDEVFPLVTDAGGSAVVRMGAHCEGVHGRWPTRAERTPRHPRPAGGAA